MKKNIKHTVTLLVLFLSVLSLKAIEGRMMVTTAPNFFDRWYKSQNELPMAHIPTTRNIYKRQVFYMLPVFTGFSTKEGKANVRYNIAIKQGDKVIFSKNGVTANTQNVNTTNSVFLSQTVLNYEFADKTQSGKYTIETEIIDYIGKDTTLLKTEINVVQYAFNEQRFTTADSFFVWQNYYYEGIGHGREIDGLMFFSFPQMQTNAESTLALLAYFTELFKGKFYLLHEVENIFLSRNKNERLTIIHVMHLAGYMPKSLQERFNDEEKKYYADLKEYGLPTIPETGIENHVLLNMQWSRFFATGNIEYAKSIVQACELSKYGGALAKFSESEKTEKDKQEAFLETVYQKNIEHLFKRLPNHPLFNGYCKYFIKSNEVSDVVKKELQAVIVK